MDTIKKRRRPHGRRRGFTLMELLVVISIICVLMAIALPSLTSAREQGKRVTCLANMKNLSYSWLMFTYDNDDRRIFQYKGDGGAAHAQNFIDALRKGSNESLNAEIEIGHLSTAMAHQANICFRAGAEATVEEIRENMDVHEDAVNTFNDMLEQLEGNGVDLNKNPFILGHKLTYDRRQERFAGENSDGANKYIKCSYRDSFVIPETV